MHYIKHLSLLLLCLIGTSLSAQIEIERSSASNDDVNCNGTIALTAQGTAGPFTVIIPGNGGQQDQVFTDVNGFMQIGDLCQGYYDVRVYPTRFPSCVTVLDVDLTPTPQKTDKAVFLFKEELAVGEIGVSVSPNPSDGRVTLDVSGGPLRPGSGVGRDWSVTVLDANGKVFHEQSAGEKASAVSLNRTFNLNLEGLIAGVYFVRVIRPDGAEGRARVILR